MDVDPLQLWCKNNGLSEGLFQKLRGTCEIESPDDLSMASKEDVEEIIKACQLSIGEKLRFKNAIRKLFPATAPLPNDTVEPAVSLVSLPLDIFDADFDELDLPDVHEAVKLGLGFAWDNVVHKKMMKKIKEHLKTQQIQDFMKERNCTLDEVGAVVYYSADARRGFFGQEHQSIYKIVNPLLAKRNQEELAPWQQFLYFLCSAEQKLPSLKARTYRGITVHIAEMSPLYKPGKDVVWPAFTSVSTKKELMPDFTENGKKGTCMVIDVIDAKDISFISLFPVESEALLFPNTGVSVLEIMGPLAKELCGLPRGPDAIHLRQNPTKEIKPFEILSQKRKLDEQKIRELWPLAFSSRDANSLYHIGKSYFGGSPEHGIPQDFNKALKYLNLASQQGNSDSQLILGTMYLKGLGVIQDHSQAFGYFKGSLCQGNQAALEGCENCAKEGNTEAKLFFGEMYCRGLKPDQPYQRVRYEMIFSKQLQVYIGVCFQGMQKYEQQDYYEKAFSYFMSVNDQQSQFYMGQMYYQGLGVAQNYEMAFKNFTLASSQGHSMSQNNLGCLYYLGKGVPQDYQKALHYFKCYSALGYVNLGSMYLGPLLDHQKAVEYFQLAGNDPYAQSSLGLMYQNGFGVVKDYQKAIDYYTISVEQRNEMGQLNLGYMYLNGLGVDKDYDKALEYCTLSASAGVSTSQNQLGYMYQKGLGVKQDYNKAIEYYTIAAEQRNPATCNNLGLMYENGLGVKQDYNKAIELYTIAAEQRNPVACCNLGCMYLEGYGVKQDYQTAIKLFTLSAQQDNSKSHERLGNIYLNGLGVLKDRQKAIQHYTIAANQGNDDAKKTLQSLQEKEDQEDSKKKTGGCAQQ